MSTVSPMTKEIHALLRVAWIAMLAVTLIFVLLLLVPFYAAGIHLMSESQIWASSPDIQWHPYYAGMTEALYVRATPVVITWFVVGLPLFTSLWVELLLMWRRRNQRSNLTRLALLLLPTLVIVAWFVSGEKLMAWIMD